MNTLRHLMYSTLLIALALMSLAAAQAVTVRGFGEIVPQPVTTHGLSGMTFRCADTDTATVFLNKMARDMAQTATLPV
ncbi:MAG TPA: hypothetical protein VGM23_06920, partial [Armatimonadota bacterium]